MGEAKRRRLMGVPFKEFRAGDGQFACTLDISGTNPVSTCIKAGELHGILRRGREKGFCPAIKKGGAEEYYSDLAWARRRLQERRDRRAGKTFNHPTGGASTTKKVSDALRQDRGAHLTITSPMPAWPSPSPTGRRSARAVAKTLPGPFVLVTEDAIPDDAPIAN